MLTRRIRTNDPFAAMTRDMDRLFESMFSSTPRSTSTETSSKWFSAPMNLWDDDDHIFIEMELPGVKLEDIEILAAGEELSIKGKREIALPEDARWLRRERGAGTFERKTSLPSEIDVDKVEATLRNGVLTVKLAKAEHRRPRKVAVKALPTKS